MLKKVDVILRRRPQFTGHDEAHATTIGEEVIGEEGNVVYRLHPDWDKEEKIEVSRSFIPPSLFSLPKWFRITIDATGVFVAIWVFSTIIANYLFHINPTLEIGAFSVLVGAIASFLLRTTKHSR